MAISTKPAVKDRAKFHKKWKGLSIKDMFVKN